MKAKYTSILVLGLLLFSSQETQAIQLSSNNSLWSEIQTTSDRPKDHSKVQLKHKKAAKKQKKKSHKKKKSHHKKSHKSDAELIADDEQKQEAAIITASVSKKLDQLDANDASLSDMYTFSKVIANGKTVKEAAKEEEQKVQALAIVLNQKKAEEEKKLDAFTKIEQEEAEKKQEAVDITTRKMLAQQYEAMEIDDERREGVDNGFQSYKVVSDMKEEQDYAINQYKGSGEMSDVLDEIKADAVKSRLKDKLNLAAVNEADGKIKAKAITEEKGETAIAGDAQSMYAFSAFAAAQAATALEK